MRRLVLSARAEADLREIWLYTFKTWGEAQADRYLDELGSILRECGAEPERGKRRDDVRPATGPGAWASTWPSTRSRQTRSSSSVCCTPAWTRTCISTTTIREDRTLPA